MPYDLRESCVDIMEGLDQALHNFVYRNGIVDAQTFMEAASELSDIVAMASIEGRDYHRRDRGRLELLQQIVDLCQTIAEMAQWGLVDEYMEELDLALERWHGSLCTRHSRRSWHSSVVNRRYH